MIRRPPRSTLSSSSAASDVYKRQVPKESRSFAKVHDPVGAKPHQPRAGCIASHRIVRKHNLSQRTRVAVKGPVSFHRHDAVRDNEVDRNGGAQIEDAFLNALPVEDVLRPSISRTRYYAKHVLHAERDAGPVVGLDLRHGTKEIRFQHCPGKPEIPHAGKTRP